MASSHDLVWSIQSGTYDGNLGKLEKAIEDRRKRIRPAQSTLDFGVGDQVRFNENCGVDYLRGTFGTVIGSSRGKLRVRLDAPVGKFFCIDDGVTKSAEVKTPPQMLDLIQ